jgi:DoxX-like family
MDTALWIAAGLLAAVALGAGASKTFVPVERLAAVPGGAWTERAGVGVVRTLGVLELLAAVGLLVPAALGVAPLLVPVTAVCLVVLMVGAMITHLRHGEIPFVVLNLVYLALAVFVAWGRFGPGSFVA